MNHLPVLVIVIFVLSILLPMIFRIFRSSPRDKARVVVTYAQRRGYVLLNPSFAQALDMSRLEMMKGRADRAAFFIRQTAGNPPQGVGQTPLTRTG